MRRILFVLLFAAGAFAQIDPYTVTVTASQTLNVQPDQAVIGGYVATGVTSNLADALDVLAPAGITAANITSVSTVNGGFTPNPNAIVWSFQIAVPLANLSSSLAAFSQIAQSAHPYLYYKVQGVEVSAQLQASQQCQTAALMAAARSQALALAQAAGFGIGALVAVSDGSFETFNGAAPAVVIADFTTLAGFLSTVSPAQPHVCRLAAKFALIPGP